MEITFKYEEDVTVAILHEKHFDLATNRAFIKFWEDLFEKKKSKIILDLSEVEFMDSHSMGILMTKVVHLRKEGGDIKLASPNEHLKKVFTLIRLGELFEIYPDAALAVEKFKNNSKK